MSQTFQRKTENFTCEHCNCFVVGNGYTNHCPKCLWCKHVDVYPGDRLSQCDGMMKPIGFSQKKGEFVIEHKCLKCGFVRKNKMNENDDMDALLNIQKDLFVL